MTADLVHFYSYGTGVSLELPVGFEADGADDTSADYVDRPSDGSATEAPRVHVNVIAELEPDSEAGALAEFATGLGAAEGEVLSREHLVVDEAPVEVVVLRRPSGTVLYQAAAAVEGRLVSVIALAPADRPELVDEYARAVASIRFVTL